MMETNLAGGVAVVVLLLAGAYLLGLGIATATHPEQVRRFLSAHASSARTHFIELVVRMVVGVALLVASPRMHGSAAFRVAGLVLAGTTIVLAVLPWRVHHRFAAWSVPIASRRLLLLGVGAVGAGVVLLAALLLPYAHA